MDAGLLPFAARCRRLVSKPQLYHGADRIGDGLSQTSSDAVSLTRAFACLPGQSSSSRLFREVGKIDRFALLATIQLRSIFGRQFRTGSRPSFQMADTSLAFGILLIARAHPRRTALDLGAVGKSF